MTTVSSLAQTFSSFPDRMPISKTLNLVSDLSLLTSNGIFKIPSTPTRSFSPTFQVQRSIRCAARKRKQYGMGRSSKFVVQSALAIALKLGVLPEPIELIMRQFGGGGGSGMGNGGGNRFWNGFGWGESGGWRRRRSTKLGVIGILAICGMGLWLSSGKELTLNFDALLGGLGLILFGISAEGWRRGFRDWILGFCCCAFLMGLVMKKGDFERLVKGFERLKKNGRSRKIF